MRMLEWSLLSLLVLAVMSALYYYARMVHAQAERAAVLTTLGALRTALIVQQLPVVAHSATDSSAQNPNPFDSLTTLPAAYAGTVQGRDVAAVADGQWVFDEGCACIGYKPLYPEWLQTDDGLRVLWFQHRGSGNTSQWVALGQYVWQDQPIR